MTVLYCRFVTKTILLGVLDFDRNMKLRTANASRLQQEVTDRLCQMQDGPGLAHAISFSPTEANLFRGEAVSCEAEGGNY